MFSKTMQSIYRGLAAIFLALLMVCTLGYGIADTWRSQVDAALGTTSYEIDTNEDAARFKSEYATIDEMAAAAKAHGIKQGREGFVLMKNDNNALPLVKTNNIALFGAAAWKPYMQSAGDLKAGNADRKNLDEALVDAGFTLDATMKDVYTNLLANYTETTRYGNTTITYNNGYVTSPGDMVEYQIRECPPDRYNDSTLGKAGVTWKDVANWKTTLTTTKTNNIGIVVFARGAGESNTYAPGKSKNFAGTSTSQDPLRLSDDELSVVQAAKDTCSKVIVLINSGNAMEIGAIAKGGSHEVDAIGYMGVINDYQCIGIVEVLAGQYNASGALPDTYATKFSIAPASINFGGDKYADHKIAEAIAGTASADPRFPTMNIMNGSTDSFGSTGTGNYSGAEYIVEAEGIYVGYNYYESRYYDSVANKTWKADSSKGSSTASGWKYANEVVYTFGHGLSYIDYEQNISSVSVDKTEDGDVTAIINVKNKGAKDGQFLAQLYVQQPYTQYDRDNKVEKSAVMFLNSKKVEVKAGQTAQATIKVPAKYLASYDYTKAKTYILDAGDYLFTAAAGAHEAVNNFLTKQNKTVSDGMDKAGKGSVVVWNQAALDQTTFAVDNGKKVTNVADDADLNYWLPGTVTYLSRSDWDATFPKNYNKDVSIKIGDSAKKDAWIKQIRGMDYTINNTGAEARNVDGKDNGVKFAPEFIGVDQLTNIEDEYWDLLVSSISVNESIGAVIHGGSRSDTLSIIDNPIVLQSEGVNGVTGKYTEDGKNIGFNICSQTILAASFSPELAYEWGILQGTAGIWLKKQHAWGTGLTQRRTPYNGRNYEYISEDAMLSNRMGYGILKGTADMGFICGPKHMGFNDQEHNRAGVAAYINEQKMRETDLRCFQGGLSEGGGLGVMIAFNRIGAVNASHHVGMNKTILRDEWGFNGVVSTDMMNNAYYFNAESMIMCTITQVAEFSANNSFINKDNNHSAVDSNWKYISVDSVKNDAKLVEQARQNLKYQFYTFANSQVLNISTYRVIPWWETTMKVLIGVTAGLAGLAVCVWVVSLVIGKKEEI